MILKNKIFVTTFLSLALVAIYVQGKSFSLPFLYFVLIGTFDADIVSGVIPLCGLLLTYSSFIIAQSRKSKWVFLGGTTLLAAGILAYINDSLEYYNYQEMTLTFLSLLPYLAAIIFSLIYHLRSA